MKSWTRWDRMRRGGRTPFPTTGFSDPDLRTCLVNATLEHLFEDRDIAKYFKDWKNDPILAQAYADGMLWVEKGGVSPLSK